MYVILLFNRYDEDCVDAVLGPFESLQDAQKAAKDKYNLHDRSNGFRHYSTQTIESEIPEWAL